MAEWIFDRISASRQRHGGSAAEYAFDPTLDVFVREVIQNANDQAVGEPEIEFRFYRLAGERLRAFWAALSWEKKSRELQGNYIRRCRRCRWRGWRRQSWWS